MVEKSSKAVVIAFSDLATTTRFLSMLSAITTAKLKRHLTKALKGRKSGSSVEVLVSEEKQFSFSYYFKRGQMDIFFYFGEWNTSMAFHKIIKGKFKTQQQSTFAKIVK